MKRLLSLATLYPNAHTPRFGTFVARCLEALAARADWQVTVINPIGIPPIAFGRYKALATAAMDGMERGVSVHRPRFPPDLPVRRPHQPAVYRPRRTAACTPPPCSSTVRPDGRAVLLSGRSSCSAARQGDRCAVRGEGAGCDISYWGKRRYPLRQMRATANEAGRLLAVSRNLADDKAKLGFPREKVAVHYTGLDRDLFRPLHRRECRQRLAQHFGLDLPQNAPLLATIGALMPRKGQEYVIRALPRLAQARLVLVGTGSDRAKLAALAASEGVAERVHFLGSLDHTMLPVVLSASDAMVLPSASEGLANAWVEALACGCPLVITDAGGARELVTSPAAGRIVRRDPQAIASAVVALLASPPDRVAVAATADCFSWHAHADELDRIYSELLRRP